MTTDRNQIEAVQAAVITAINTLGVTLLGQDFTPITSSPIPDDEVAQILARVDHEQHRPPKCSSCRRERTIDDAYDYNPLQVMTGKPLGWYSGDDGEVCPECMTKMIRSQ